jgi:outer membrane protein assembly factor BamB
MDIYPSPRYCRRRRPSFLRVAWLTSAALLWLCAPAGISDASATDVITQHNDVQRTGGNSNETVLTASNVKSATFGLLHSVAVDDQVDAQPLVLANQPISGVQGNRNVVYVATEGNTVYAIDASSGTVLLKKNFGTPVPKAVFGNCSLNATHIGINSTPVIDRAAGRLFVVTYTSDGGVPTYRLHALSVTTLADAIPPIVVTASQRLTNGTTYTFQASKDRQRAGLLEANGNIYVAFTSFCDFFANLSRGWVLGWSASTLKPLAANYLNDKLAPSASNNYFLSNVWMSGNGLAASTAGGGIFFATGNTGRGTYNSVNNLSESVVNLSSDLTRVTDFFTPSNVTTMDANDSDLSGGGVLLIPPQSGPVPNLAVAGGKDGRMFLLNQQNLGKFTAGGPDKVLATLPLSKCFCAESYYKGSDGVGRVVTSAGNTIIVWKAQTSPSVTLVRERTLPALVTGQDPGFFTSVSSNGSSAGSAVIWAVSRPTNTSPANVLLYAFNAATGALLFSANAGTWPNGGNANIVPVVANGQVFVGSKKQLAIFGPRKAGAAAASPAPVSSQAAIPASGNQVSGWIDQINGTELVLKKRDGTHVTIDAKPAEDAFQSVPISMEEAVTAEGTYDAQGVLHAQTIVRAKDSVALWPPDQ